MVPSSRVNARRLSQVNAVVAVVAAAVVGGVLAAGPERWSGVLVFLPCCVAVLLARLAPFAPPRISVLHATLEPLDDDGRAVVRQALFLGAWSALVLAFLIAVLAYGARLAAEGHAAIPPGTAALLFAWAAPTCVRVARPAARLWPWSLGAAFTGAALELVAATRLGAI